MIVNQFYLAGVAILSPKANAPLVVNTYAYRLERLPGGTVRSFKVAVLFIITSFRCDWLYVATPLKAGQRARAQMIVYNASPATTTLCYEASTITT